MRGLVVSQIVADALRVAGGAVARRLPGQQESLTVCQLRSRDPQTRAAPQIAGVLPLA